MPKKVIKVIKARERARDWPARERLIHDVWFDLDMSPRASFAALMLQIPPLKTALLERWASSKKYILDPIRPGFAIVSSTRAKSASGAPIHRFLSRIEATDSGRCFEQPFCAEHFEVIARQSPGGYLFIRTPFCLLCSALYS